MLLRGFQALCIGGATAILLMLLSAQFPAINAGWEEAQIFNADNASTFGEDPEPQRNLQLLALGRDEIGQLAQLSVDGGEQQLHAGDLILPCVKLADILNDAVLIDNCGNYALLEQAASALNQGLILQVNSNARLNAVAPTVIDLRQDAVVTNLIGDYRQRLYKRPLSLRNVVNIDVRVDPLGERRYYLSPGEDPVLFRVLPLRAGDRVVSVNGVNLAASEALTDIYAALADLNQLALTLERGEHRIVLLLRF